MLPKYLFLDSNEVAVKTVDVGVPAGNVLPSIQRRCGNNSAFSEDVQGACDCIYESAKADLSINSAAGKTVDGLRSTQYIGGGDDDAMP